uniref:CHCH domain-containing protein n=1 Tax=Peronospora matthiolae TaxID=2874970 RepID=A0AAV1UVK7_9STRA
MGAKQSRVVAPETAAELRPEEDYEAETRTSIRLTPALIDQINGTHGASNSAKQAVSGLTPQQQEFVKKQLQLAFAKGADEQRKKMELTQKATAKPSPAHQAQLAREQEERENQRVEQLVEQINKKKYRAPLRDVQCSPEREACLECYRDEKSNVLKCKEVADAFVQCARQNTENFVGEN